jgi:hypothetical protein
MILRPCRVCLSKGFPLINLGAWNDDPLVIRAIKERIDTKREESLENW